MEIIETKSLIIEKSRNVTFIYKKKHYLKGKFNKILRIIKESQWK